MNRFKIVVSVLVVSALSMLLTNCKKDDPTPLTAQREAAKKLSVTWGSAQILSSPVAGADGTLENLVLTFTVTGNFQPDKFSASGAQDFFLTNTISKWSWGNTSSATRILLSNVSPIQEFTVDELTETNLTISFMFSGPVGGRVKGVGEYQVSFTRVP